MTRSSRQSDGECRALSELTDYFEGSSDRFDELESEGETDSSSLVCTTDSLDSMESVNEESQRSSTEEGVVSSHRSKIRDSSFSAIPHPVSETDSVALSSVNRTRIEIVPCSNSKSKFRQHFPAESREIDDIPPDNT